MSNSKWRKNTSFNGWENKETWLVNVWLGDDLQAHKDEGEALTADYMEALVDDMATDVQYGPSGLLSDLLNTALGEINYWELEQSYKEDDE